MSLAPPPLHDAIASPKTGRVETAWWQWFSQWFREWQALDTNVAANSQNITELQTRVLQNTVNIAALSQAGGMRPFDAAEFRGTDAMTWTVAAGHVRRDHWTRVGRMGFWSFDYAGTPIGGIASTALLRALPSGLVASGDQCGTFGLRDGGGSVVPAFWTIDDGDADLVLRKGHADASMDEPIFTGPTVSVFGQIHLEVRDT